MDEIKEKLKDHLLDLSGSVNIEININTKDKTSIEFTIGNEKIILTKEQTDQFLAGLKDSIDARITIQ